MTKKVLKWKLNKEIEAAAIKFDSANAKGNKEEAVLYHGVIIGLSTAVENVDKYSEVEKEFKGNN